MTPEHPQFDVPILLLTFNRQESARRTLLEIRKQRPLKLYLSSDGGRTTKEHTQIEAIRSALIDLIDWPCEVIRIFHARNLGCRKGVLTALDQLFQEEASAIILEDDCLPHPLFFNYCRENLLRYAEDHHVGTIAGTRFLSYPTAEIENSGQFSEVFACWGWASWQRAYCKKSPAYSQLEDRLASQTKHRSYFRYWHRIRQHCQNPASESWAYPMTLQCFLRKQLHLLPPQNLIVNQGFSKAGTHTHWRPSHVPIKFDDTISTNPNAPPMDLHDNTDLAFMKTQFQPFPIRWHRRALEILQRAFFRNSTR